jgi:CDP-glucose 4,6-dehydratase
MSFWNGKKILITGAGGFVGSNLAKALLNKRAHVFTFSSRPLPSDSLLALEGLDNQIAKQERGLLVDINRLDSVVRDNKIEVVFHLAAQPLVDLGRQNPIKTFEINIQGTWNVLEVARRNNVEKMVIASTTHVYGENPNLPFKEEFYPQPSRPYETSKACADLIAQCFADTYSVPIEIPRFVNLYGPGDMNFSRIIPKVIKSVLSGENPELWDMHAVRDFLFIEDAIRGYLSLVEKGRPNEKRVTVMNFGSSKLVNVVDLARTIIKIVGNPNVKVKLIQVPEARTQEIAKQYVSIDKAKRELSWEPIYSLEKGLEISLEWYKKYLLKNN